MHYSLFVYNKNTLWDYSLSNFDCNTENIQLKLWCTTHTSSFVNTQKISVCRIGTFSGGFCLDNLVTHLLPPLLLEKQIASRQQHTVVEVRPNATVYVQATAPESVPGASWPEFYNTRQESILTCTESLWDFPCLKGFYNLNAVLAYANNGTNTIHHALLI